MDNIFKQLMLNHANLQIITPPQSPIQRCGTLNSKRVALISNGNIVRREFHELGVKLNWIKKLGNTSPL
jgi:hypothetical protein